METRVFQAPEPPAYFQAAKKPFQVIPQKNLESGRVEWLVVGDHIDAALQEMYQNALVGVLDFIKELKGLRSSIFALKGEARKTHI